MMHMLTHHPLLVVLAFSIAALLNFRESNHSFDFSTKLKKRHDHHQRQRQLFASHRPPPNSGGLVIIIPTAVLHNVFQ